MTELVAGPARRSLLLINHYWRLACRPLCSCPRLAKRAVRVAVALLLAYLLLVVALLPPLLRWGWPQLAERLWQQPAAVGSVLFNPFDGSLRLADLRLGAAEQPALQLDLLQLQPAWWSSLLHQRWVVERLQLDGVRAEVQRQADGRLSIDWLWQNLAADEEPATPESAPPALLIRQLQLNAEQLMWRDLAVAPAVELVLSPLQLRLDHLSTVAGEQGQLQLQVARSGGGRLQLNSHISLLPLAADGQLQFSGLPLAAGWGYVAPVLNLQPLQGRLGGSSAFKLALGAELQLQLTQLALAVDGLAVMAPEQNTPLLQLQRLQLADSQLDLQRRQLQLGQLLLADGQLNVAFAADGSSPWLALLKAPPATASNPAPQVGAVAAPPAAAAPPVAPAAPAEPAAVWQLQLAAGQLQRLAVNVSDRRMRQPLAITIAAIDAELSARFGAEQQLRLSQLKLRDSRLGPLAKPPQFTLAELALDQAELDLVGQQLQLGNLSLTRFSTALQRDAQGQWPLLALFQPQASPQPAAADAKEKGKPWQLVLKQLALVDADLAVSDASMQPPLAYQWRQLQLQLAPLRWPLAGSSSLNLRSGKASAGEWQLQGPIDLAQQQGELGYRIEGMELAPLQHFLSQALALQLAEGKLYSNGQLQFDAATQPPKARLSGTASLGNVRLLETEAQEQLVGWRQLRADGIALDSNPFSLKIATIKLRKPEAKVVVFSDRTTNLGRLAPAPAVAPTTTVEAPPPAVDRDAGALVQVERMEVTDGAVDFADLSLILPFATRIHEFNGLVSGISSAAATRASLQLEGQVAEYGEARVSGELAPAAPKQFSDVQVQFRNLALSPLSPYTATFAGRTIAAGRLNLDLQYRVENGKLNSENAIVLRGLKLGDTVDSTLASNLPLDLALALLTDSEGQIDITLPVGGDVDSPEFSYGQVVGQAMTTLLTNVITSPFRALGNLFGDGRKLPEQVGFLPGRSQLSSSQREQVLNLGDALLAKPELQLQVRGAFDPQLDLQALRQAGLRAAVASYQDMELGGVERFSPLPLGDGRSQYALEQLLLQAQGEAALAEVAAAFAETHGRAPEPVGLIGSELGQASVDADYYRLISERLLPLQAVSDADLQQLAQARAEAVVAAMTAAGLPATRVAVDSQIEQKKAANAGEAQDPLINVGLKLDLVKAG